jgi:N-acetylglucosamine-6-phosphate deacetylase
MSLEEGYRSAHIAEYMKRPKVSEFRHLQKAAGGSIRLLTLAPEWPGSARFNSADAASGVGISLCQTNSELIEDAIRAGARMCAHLRNGCPMLMPRHDNITQRLLARDEVATSIIPDGIHIPPRVLKNFLRAEPRSRIVITTNVVATAGAPPGPFFMQRRKKMVRCVFDRKGRGAFSGHSGHFFGFPLTLDKGVVNFSRWTEFSAKAAWDWASHRSAEILGIRLPRIEVPLPPESGSA